MSKKRFSDYKNISFKKVKIEHSFWFELFVFTTILMDGLAITFSIMFFDRESNKTLEILFITFTIIAICSHLFSIVGWRLQIYLNFKKYFKGINFVGEELISNNSNKTKWIKNQKEIFIKFKIKYFIFFTIETRTNIFSGNLNFAIIDFSNKTMNIFFDQEKNNLKKQKITEEGLITLDLKDDVLSFFKNPKNLISFGEFKTK